MLYSLCMVDGYDFITTNEIQPSLKMHMHYADQAL